MSKLKLNYLYIKFKILKSKLSNNENGKRGQ